MSSPGLTLYAVLVGGKHTRANIELHDVHFVVAHSIEGCVPALRERWWGVPGSLHIDAYAEIRTVDGFTITPEPRKAAAGERALYFVNTGGYEPGVFNELHAFSFHVSSDRKAVWAEARRRAASFASPHQDNFDLIDDVVCVDAALAPQTYALAFTPTDASDDIRITAKYIKLGA